jgi:hypothetical protein
VRKKFEALMCDGTRAMVMADDLASAVQALEASGYLIEDVVLVRLVG